MKTKEQLRCPYWKKCKAYSKKGYICNQGEGYYGTKFKADSCLK